VAGLDVVRLVERVDDGFPVRGDDRGEVRPEPHLFEVVAAEQVGERVEELVKRRRVRVEVHEDEPAPAFGAHRGHLEVVGDVVEVLDVDHLDDAAVERVPPAVERAPERPVGHVARAFSEPCAAVEARVRECRDRVGAGADNQYRLVADLVLDIVADLGDLLFAARDLPDARPQALVLELEELAREVALLRDQSATVVGACSSHFRSERHEADPTPTS
jgi:hypothetical protein